MSFDNYHLYNIKFSFKTLEANCQRSLCRVHLAVKIQNEEKRLKETPEMKKNIAVFNSQQIWEELAIKYNQVSGTYMDTPVLISIFYQTPQSSVQTLKNSITSNSSGNKIKIGQVSINLAKLLNAKTYRIVTQYNVEKCYDNNAKLKVGVDAVEVGERDVRQGRKGRQDREDRGRNEFGGYGYTDDRDISQELNNKKSNLQIRNSSTWKMSKVHEKMNQNQKLLLQNKLYQYQQRLQKHRQAHNDQLKRLTEHLSQKQQRLSTLSTQNSTLTQSLQSAQLALQKQTSKCTSLQTQLQNAQQQYQTLQNSLKAQTRELSSLKEQLEEYKVQIEQSDISKQKKEGHFKQELEKYMNKFMEAENGRNRIVFEMETKIREELEKKDSYYKDIINKLQARLHSNTALSKQSLQKRQKQYGALVQKHEATIKQNSLLQIQLSETKQFLQQQSITVTTLQSQLTSTKTQLKSLQQQSQLSELSNNTLHHELQKHKSESKLNSKTMEQLKEEIDLAGKTIEEQERLITRLNREIRVFRQREYYMEEKYQGELENVTYNQEIVRDVRGYYKGLVAKLELKNKLLQDKHSQAEETVAALERDKHRLSQQVRVHSKSIFQLNQQLIHLQTQLSSHKQSNQQLQSQLSQLQSLQKQSQESYNILLIQSQQTESELASTINYLQLQIKSLKEKNNEDARSWELEYNRDSLQKNALLGELQLEVRKLRVAEEALRAEMRLREDREFEVLAELDQERDKLKMLERDAIKHKFQLSKLIDEKQLNTKQEAKMKAQIIQYKNQLSTLKNQHSKLIKKANRQKQSYVDLIKWILDRIWDYNYSGHNFNYNYNASSTSNIDVVSLPSPKTHTSPSFPFPTSGPALTLTLTRQRQYIQQASPQIELQLITYINSYLEKIYIIMEKYDKVVDRVRDDNERMGQEIARYRLEMQYEEEFGDGKDREKDQSSSRINLRIKDDRKNRYYTQNSQFLIHERWQNHTISDNTKINKSITNQHFMNHSNQIPPFDLQLLHAQPLLEPILQSLRTQSQTQNTVILQLQQTITSKTLQIQSINEQLFEERMKVRELEEEVKGLKQEVEELGVVVSKKNARILELQAEKEVEGTLVNITGGGLRYLPSGTTYNPFKHSPGSSSIQPPVLQPTSPSNPHKTQQLSKQNTLLKTKQQLLQNRLKLSSEKISVYESKISALEKSVREKEDSIRKLGRRVQELEGDVSEKNKSVELLEHRVAKKEEIIEQLKRHLLSSASTIQSLTSQQVQNQSSHQSAMQSLQSQLQATKAQLLSLTESFTSQRLNSQKQGLQSEMELTTLRSQAQTNEQRISALQNLLEKSKKQGEQLHEKYLKQLAVLHEKEEEIKDRKVREDSRTRDSQRILTELREKLQAKEFQLEEVRFAYESRILELQKRIEDMDTRHDGIIEI